ncbi:restriction endonuclease subunit S [Acinetobacter lactucae]|jgi:type I restriction enzyme S subunit|uniref:Restriction endonuclease subunit S n=1 Tax=Acinetobacter lactucae TaxID=1785128 RepID=A0AB35JYX9_9GAMM|nr:restriction endonuclease subunit S [Acinetobacter lactucae]MDD9316198.1 restriction endonuclease subunit S [Acinetobacter lactucae]MDD9320353.1 restriction endonuclease subunit S [Acinetobacter lactucae]
MMIQQNLFNVQDEINTPVGYKKTEVGIIPEDWIIRSIGDFAPLQRGFDLPSRLRKDGLYPVIYSNGFVNTHTEYKVKGPGILTGRSGTIGKVHYVEQNYWPHNTSLWVTKFNEVDPKFIYFLFSKIGFERFLSGSGVPTLNRNDAHSFMIQLPKSIEEQKKIARVLSDTDALISELAKIIEKKQAIKTATMQQLLTGTTRLPEFALREDGTPKGYKESELGQIPEDWGVALLADAVTFLDGLRKPVKASNRSTKQGVYPYYGASGIVDYVDDYIFDDNLILLGEDGENILSRNLPLAFKVSGKVWVNNHAHVMKPRPDFNISYLTEFLESLDYSLLNSGTAQPKLNKKTCMNIKVLKPSLAEQILIGNIIDEMDQEILLGIKRLNKIKSIKQGMMQELLTGKTRLV